MRFLNGLKVGRQATKRDCKWESSLNMCLSVGTSKTLLLALTV